ncbi:hypothetical protein [Kribbella deserti]|uniref:Uncharacterized protein n=1 Tax=Kribbella deserti TaxID=1926257 RepID=A0ABV6QF26_9ACTN
MPADAPALPGDSPDNPSDGQGDDRDGIELHLGSEPPADRRSRIQNQSQALQWLRDGKSFAWMSSEHERLYHITISHGTWSKLARKNGIVRNVNSDSSLIPWNVKPEHRAHHYYTMLRLERRRKAGKPLSEKDQTVLQYYKNARQADDQVIDYDPDSEQGFTHVPRRPGIDRGMIREPGQN